MLKIFPLASSIFPKLFLVQFVEFIDQKIIFQSTNAGNGRAQGKDVKLNILRGHSS